MRNTADPGIRGGLIPVNYPASLVSPTGVIVPGPVVLNGTSSPANIAINSFNNAAAGLLNIAITYNTSGSPNDQFTGQGVVLWVEFQLLSTNNYGTVIPFYINSFTESFNFLLENECVDGGSVFIQGLNPFDGRVIFHNDQNRPLIGDGFSNPTYNSTFILPTDPNCNFFGNPNLIQEPDANGDFSIFLNPGDYVRFSRTIQNPGLNDFIGVIDATDLFNTFMTVVQNPTMVPDVYEIMAMDVNLNGVVDATDFFQIGQFSVLGIPNYIQDPTYLNGNAFVDWRFIDDETVQIDPLYTISGNFPQSDNLGYSSSSVPPLELCLATDTTNNNNCITFTPKLIHSVLLGDVDGSWSHQPTDATHFRTAPNGAIELNLGKAVSIGDCKVRIPVYVDHIDPVYALDLNLSHHQDNFKFVEAEASEHEHSESILFANDPHGDKALIRAIASKGRIASGQQICWVEAEISNEVGAGSFEGSIGKLNGEWVPIHVTGSLTCKTGSNLVIADVTDYEVNVYPNPFGESFRIDYRLNEEEITSLEIFNVMGQKISDVPIRPIGWTEFQADRMPAGIYFLKVNKEKTIRLVHTN